MSAVKQNIQLDVFRRDKYRCAYCGKSYGSNRKLSIDHVVPKDLGGTNHRTNLVTACVKCNRKKGNMLLTTYIEKFNVKVTPRIAKLL